MALVGNPGFVEEKWDRGVLSEGDESFLRLAN